MFELLVTGFGYTPYDFMKVLSTIFIGTCFLSYVNKNKPSELKYFDSQEGLNYISKVSLGVYMLIQKRPRGDLYLFNKYS